MSDIPAHLERLVRLRAGDRCEYCQLPELPAPFPLTIDHVIARQHGGESTAQNLALACGHCNHRKGPTFPALSGQIRPSSGSSIPVLISGTSIFDGRGLNLSA